MTTVKQPVVKTSFHINPKTHLQPSPLEKKLNYLTEEVERLTKENKARTTADINRSKQIDRIDRQLRAAIQENTRLKEKIRVLTETTNAIGRQSGNLARLLNERKYY